MKKVLLCAALLCGVSLIGNASVSHTKVAPRKAKYCQYVSFAHRENVSICGDTWQEYVECLREAKALFD